MTIKNYVKGNLQTLAIIAGILILIYFLFKIKILLLFIFISMAVALICRPLVYFLSVKLKLNNTLSSIITLLIMIYFVLTMLWMFTPIILEQSQNISEIDLNLVKRDLNELSVQASEYLGVEKIDIIEAIKANDYITNINKEFLSRFSDFFIIHGGDILAGIFAVLFMSFFILKDDRLLYRASTAVIPKKHERRLLVVIVKCRVLLTRYFLGLTLQTLLIALFYFLILYYLNIENGIAIALVCAFLNIVPYLGPIIGAAAMLLVVLASNLASDFSSQLLPELLTVIIGVGIIQILDNLIFQPFIFGKSVKSHPLEVFLSIIVFGLLFGIPGMILAIPIYTTLKVLSKEFLSEYKFIKRLTNDI